MSSVTVSIDLDEVRLEWLGFNPISATGNVGFICMSMNDIERTDINFRVKAPRDIQKLVDKFLRIKKEVEA